MSTPMHPATLARRRAARGRRWLEAHWPGITARIDRAKLRIESTYTCAIGQTCGWHAYDETLEAARTRDHYEHAIRHGFVEDARTVGYRHLQPAWEAELDAHPVRQSHG